MDFYHDSELRSLCSGTIKCNKYISLFDINTEKIYSQSSTQFMDDSNSVSSQNNSQNSQNNSLSSSPNSSPINSPNNSSQHTPRSIKCNIADDSKRAKHKRIKQIMENSCCIHY